MPGISGRFASVNSNNVGRNVYLRIPDLRRRPFGESRDRGSVWRFMGRVLPRVVSDATRAHFEHNVSKTTIGAGRTYRLWFALAYVRLL